MKASFEKTDKNQGVLTVEVNEQKFAEALDKAFKKVVVKVNVPGFRKGKVPRSIFESRFGVESLYQDAMDILLPEAYSNAVKETGIHPIDRPEIDVEQIEKGKSFIFKATVLVKPEVELGQYKGIEIEPKEFSVTDEEVEAELKNRQERVASIEVVEDDNVPLQDGDHSSIDFEGFVDNEPFEGGKAENYDLVIGSGTFIPGFEDQMIGMKMGEVREIQVTFPENYHQDTLAGKPALFKVTLNGIKRKNLPALDDEFAKDVSEFDTLEEFKQDLRKNLEEKKKTEEENYKRDFVVDKAAELSSVEIPEVMIKNEAHRMVHEFEDRLKMQGLNLETYFQFTGLNEEAMIDQFKENAEKRVRINLTLDTIATVENIEVSEDEVEAELDQLAEQYKRSKDEIKTIFAAQGVLGSIKDDLRIRKTVDFLLENSKTA